MLKNQSALYLIIQLAIVASAGIAIGADRPHTAQRLDTVRASDELRPNLAGMRVQLFQYKTATLSDDVLLRDRQNLINVFTGADAANSALVIVEISGPPRRSFTGVKVHLIAQELNRKTSRLLDQTQEIPVFSESGRVFLGFWLVPGGCAPVVLTATLVGVSSSKPMQKNLDFVCGE
jgi:hypothetical protein